MTSKLMEERETFRREIKLYHFSLKVKLYEFEKKTQTT
jgi:hypothetical protein